MNDESPTVDERESSRQWAAETAAGERFDFGKNWSKFARDVSEADISRAEQEIRILLGGRSIVGKSFLDIGCGSGLMSLAAHRLGAKVVGFDFDANSVATTRALLGRFIGKDHPCKVYQGSVLDQTFVRSLGTFDIVYSWGVLHHTGGMWAAIENAARAVSDGGLLSIALYNDQGRRSGYWLTVKKLYNRSAKPIRAIVFFFVAARLWLPTFLRDAARGNPLKSWRAYRQQRGMSPWRDIFDWIGGLPFEVATPDAVFARVSAMGFQLQYLKTCGGGLGCNEFTFSKSRTGAIPSKSELTGEVV